MRWLVTTRRNADLERLSGELATLGASLDAGRPVPSGPDLQVVGVEGPRDLAPKARGLPQVVAVHPDSEMQLYRAGD